MPARKQTAKKKKIPAGRVSKNKSANVSRPRKPVKSSVSKPKKKRAVPVRWGDRTDEDWDRWGNQLGKRIESRFKNFGEEMECHGKRIEKHGSKFEKCAASWWNRTFGWVGPLLESVFGALAIIIAAIILLFLSTVLFNSFLSRVSTFLYNYLGIFFILMFLFNYEKYITKRISGTRIILKPLSFAARFVVTLWIFAWLALIAFQTWNINILNMFSSFIFPNMWTIFVILLVFAYVFGIVFYSVRDDKNRKSETMKSKSRKESKPKKERKIRKRNKLSKRKSR